MLSSPQLTAARQARARKSCGNAGLDELPPRPGVARPAVVP